MFNQKSDIPERKAFMGVSEANKLLVDRVGYPCGHSRRVELHARGWNFCTACRRYFSQAEINVNPAPLTHCVPLPAPQHAFDEAGNPVRLF